MELKLIPQKAAYWYKAAALNGDSRGTSSKVGHLLLLTGTGVNKDYEQAAYWFTKSRWRKETQWGRLNWAICILQDWV